MKDYTKQIRGWKILFWVLLSCQITTYYMLPYFNYRVCEHIYIYMLCEGYLYAKLFFFSFFFIPLLNILWLPKDKYPAWRNCMIFFTILALLNLCRGEMYDDFFYLPVGYRPTALYIAIVAFIFSPIIAYRRTKKQRGA